MRHDNSPAVQRERSFIEQARRLQIADAAAEAVAELGYAKTSLARIAEKAGISKGVITYHFGSKDEILRLVATQFFDRCWQYMEPRILAEETAIGQVKVWVGSQLEYFSTHRVEFLAMAEIMTNHRGGDGTLAYAEEIAEEIDGVAEILRRGQLAGELRQFDPRSVANIILRSADGVLSSWATSPSLDLMSQSSVLLDFIEHAIRKEPS
ncbi:TetR/AcrR family transcriptional regulator [Zhihengliuella halotolerans]|uniref:TetR family transcriptional regulator n=1 Tax=Zhihengliuella halotolerans TaxID=370736 RepID=A0A4Q8AEP9_9MICC|nr:TetR/AcrR family transcriptional regulator [Zhihengliuella halotolerans]RZU62767.1 TetR family transcriptional regulator [Zhihengliuella halotolerans]